MAIADCIGYLATSPPVPAGLEVPDSGLVGALILCGFPATASVGALFVYHASSIWVPGMGGLIARLSTRRAGTIERAPTGVNTGHGPVGSGSRRRPGRRRLTGPALKPTDRWARLRAASSKLRRSQMEGRPDQGALRSRGMPSTVRGGNGGRSVSGCCGRRSRGRALPACVTPRGPSKRALLRGASSRVQDR